MTAVLQPSSPPRWYALAVHVRSERAAAEALVPVVDDVFLPVRIERRPWSDRVRRVEVPLFPGYLFVRGAMTARRRVDLLRCRHAIELVGRLPSDERICRSVPDHEITSLRLVVDAERALDPVDLLVVGRAVRVVSGPLRGATGIVEEPADGQRRLVVQVALLGRGVRAVLCADDVVEDGDSLASAS